LDALGGYPAHKIVSYETLCADPMGGFKRLFDFAGLMWNDWIEEFIGRNSRNSKRMIGAWRGHVSPGALEALRSSYHPFDLLWYQEDGEW
jgi:hypothetical protein